MPRMMSERKAWLYIAKCIEKALPNIRNECIYSYFQVKHRETSGICGAISILQEEGLIDEGTRNSMKWKVVNKIHMDKIHMSYRHWPWAYPRTKAGHKIRIALCLKFAADLCVKEKKKCRSK